LAVVVELADFIVPGAVAGQILVKPAAGEQLGLFGEVVAVSPQQM
jgi:hypothetical protein